MSERDQFIAMRPAGGFGLIMADPPWSFDNFSTRGEAKNAKAHYDCTPVEWIAGLPVGLMTAKDCLLWLWATNPLLPEALMVLTSWGFTFKTAGTWVKRTVRGKDAFGTGYILRSANEPFLIGTRGAPKTTRSTRSVIPTYDDGVGREGDWPAATITIEGVVREHSAKPEAGYVAAEMLMPDVQRIELFSRRNRPGWSSWGNEVGKLDEGGA